MDPAELIQLMQYEDRANGVWNYLISQIFPFPYYLVIPEYQSNGGRADLAVLQLNNNRLVLVFEGKRAGGGLAAMAHAAKQAANAVAARGSTPGIVAALGPKFCLYKSNGDQVTSFASADKDGFSTISDTNMQKILEKLQKCQEWGGSGGW